MEQVWGVAGFIVSIIAIPITFIVARRSRLKPQLNYITDYDMLLDAKDDVLSPGLEINLAGEPIERLCRTYLAIWNYKGDTIRGADIVDGDPLRIELSEGDVLLEASILSISRTQNKIILRTDPQNRRVIYVDFDFLDASDGALLKVVHQGTQGATVSGTVRGAVLKNKGYASLRNSAARPTDEKSLARRMARRLLANGGEVLVYTLTGAMSVGTIALLVAMGRIYRNPKLVAPNDFELTTLEGQKSFSDKVRDVGSINSTVDIAIAVILAVFAGFFVYRIFSRVRRPIPSSILLIRPSELND